MSLKRAARTFAGLMAACVFANVACAKDESLLEQSRELARGFGQQLETALIQALSESGPAAAISVCRDLAPQIASQLSRQSGAKVSRTSRRYRNPANAPESWQASVLEQFQQAAVDDPLEYFTDTGGTVRYMKGIRLGSKCMICHGTTLADPVVGQLDLDYPHDRARGYRPGELRGAFSISWTK